MLNNSQWQFKGKTMLHKSPRTAKSYSCEAITYLSVSYGSSPPELGSEHIPPTLSQEREQCCCTLNGEKKIKLSNNLYLSITYA